jgi:hypothetical protein
LGVHFQKTSSSSPETFGAFAFGLDHLRRAHWRDANVLIHIADLYVRNWPKADTRAFRLRVRYGSKADIRGSLAALYKKELARCGFHLGRL